MASVCSRKHRARNPRVKAIGRRRRPRQRPKCTSAQRVAAQRETIEELKAMVEKLAGVKAAAVNNASPQIGQRDAPLAAASSCQFPAARQRSSDERGSARSGSGFSGGGVGQTSAVAPKKDAPLTADGPENTSSSVASTDNSASALMVTSTMTTGVQRATERQPIRLFCAVRVSVSRAITVPISISHCSPTLRAPAAPSCAMFIST